MQIAFSNFNATQESDGVWLGVSVDATLMKMSEAPKVALTSGQLAEKARDALDANRPACAENSRVEVLVGNIKVGPNNEFVKVFRQIGKALDDTGQTAEKAAEDAKKAAEKAAEDVKRTAKKAAEDAKKAAEKAVEDAKKAADKAGDDLRSSLNPGTWNW